jgi:hypothetical protein
MKHIVPKVNKFYKTSFDASDISNIDIPEKSKEIIEEYKNSKSINDDYDLAVFTSNHQLVFGFDYMYKGNKNFIPELDPSVIYFSSAQLFSKMIYSYKRELLSQSSLVRTTSNEKKENQSIDATIKQFEVFFQFASSYIIMLSASLEAFVNKMIPIDYTYTTKKGLIKNLEWVLKQNIELKLSKIIPECTQKDYAKEFNEKYESILNIKNFRNELIHLSPKNELTNTKYKEFYRKVIDFRYSDSIYAIRDYINYYEEGLIEECDCGNEIYFDIHKK